MQPWLQPMQARISSSLPARALAGMSGSEISARVMPQTSAWPDAMMRSASCGWLMRPATKTGRPVAARIAPAFGAT